MSSPGEQFDRVADVVVIGSGAGGMVAALAAADLGLDVLILEKASLYGGSTALSGGGAWAPNAPELLRAGQRDDPQAVIEYLQAIAPRVSRARHERYVADNLRIHRLIVAGAGNPALAEAHAALLVRLQRARNLALRSPGRVAGSIDEHRAILAALQARDGAAAQHLVLEHNARTGAIVAAGLEGP